MNEFEIIKKYFAWDNQEKDHPELAVGVGDDCALIELSKLKGTLAITTDTLVEGVHFFKESNPLLLACKALLVNLSDLAAMGARPLFFTLSLVLTEKEYQNLRFIEALSRGFKTQAREAGIALVGGNLSKGSEFSITISIFGECEHKLLRSKALVNDLIFVTGNLGAPALYVEYGYKRVNLERSLKGEASYKFFKPNLRTDFAYQAAHLIHSAIDISDGLVGDLKHILRQSKVGALIRLKRLPVDLLLEKAHLNFEQQLSLSLFGGGDYELIFTVKQDKRLLKELYQIAKKTNTKLSLIGRITDKKEILEVKEPYGKALLDKGCEFVHF